MSREPCTHTMFLRRFPYTITMYVQSITWYVVTVHRPRAVDNDMSLNDDGGRKLGLGQ